MPPRPRRCSAGKASGGPRAFPTSVNTRQQRSHLRPGARAISARSSPVARDGADVGDDGEFGPFGRVQQLRLVRREFQRHRGLQRGADHIGAAGFLQRDGDAAADRAQLLPFRGQRGRRASRAATPGIAAGGRCPVASLFAEAGGPGLLRGEAQHRREPGAQAAMQMVQHRPRGAAAETVRAGRSRPRPCGYRSRTPTGRWRRNYGCPDKRRSSRSFPPRRGSSRRSRSSGAGCNVPAPACPRPERIPPR